MQLLAPELISTKVQTRTNGSRKNMYSVDRQEPKLLDVKNWKVIADICSQKHSIACEVDFFKHLRREFRVEQGEKGLLVNKQVVNKQVAENSKKAAQLVTSHFTNVAELFTLSKLRMFVNMIFKLLVTIYKTEEILKQFLAMQKFSKFLTSGHYLIMIVNLYSVFPIL